MNAIKLIFRFAVLYVLFIVFFVVGSLAVAGFIPPATTLDLGLVSETNGLLIIAFANVFLISALILTSRWSSWKLALSLAIVYYGAVTFVMQIETWYFLSAITVSPQLLPRLFLMGIPIAFIFIPVAVWVLGKSWATEDTSTKQVPAMSAKQWIWKLTCVSFIYLLLYWGAGYFIAWQNPELRAFYGQAGEALPFFIHTANTLIQDPALFPFQILRAMIWVICALPIIRGSRVNPWWTALLVGLLFSVPQNIGHIMANPLLPIASVRLSHMIETASSTFIFGAIVVWFFHRKHHSFSDLIYMSDTKSKGFSIQSFARKVGRIMLIIISVFLACILFLATVLILMSPGKPEPMVDENGRTLAGSISEKIFVRINGLEQGMIIQSKDASNPVLLYLHGGMPDYFLKEKYPTGLEDEFTVVWWEQRGSGLSYNDTISKESITLEQLISDTLEVTNYLRNRFHQEKIYLMGRSGGSFFGIQVAERAPELFHAYIGVGQMSNQLNSEKLAYDYMLKEFKANGNTEMVRKLEAAPVTTVGGIPDAYLALRDQGMHSLGIGTTHEMKSIITGFFLPSLTFREYTLMEKINMWRAKARNGVSVLWNTNLDMDLSQEVLELDLPVYFFEGIYDYTCSFNLAKDYFEKLKAPVKGFYTFEQSAHSPIFEEPEKSLRILREDVLVGANNLADIK